MAALIQQAAMLPPPALPVPDLSPQVYGQLPRSDLQALAALLTGLEAATNESSADDAAGVVMAQMHVCIGDELRGNFLGHTTVPLAPRYPWYPAFQFIALSGNELEQEVRQRQRRQIASAMDSAAAALSERGQFGFSSAEDRSVQDTQVSYSDLERQGLLLR